LCGARQRWKVELTCRVLFQLLQLHQAQLVAHRAARSLLDTLRTKARAALAAHRVRRHPTQRDAQSDNEEKEPTHACTHTHTHTHTYALPLHIRRLCRRTDKECGAGGPRMWSGSTWPRCSMCVATGRRRRRRSCWRRRPTLTRAASSSVPRWCDPCMHVQAQTPRPLYRI
jgi:hypothetical protein